MFSLLSYNIFCFLITPNGCNIAVREISQPPERDRKL
nr:MAG TPA: hypothetical protein [Caudoviricetes sp.]